jgi:fibro-slime domain-containing protein
VNSPNLSRPTTRSIRLVLVSGAAVAFSVLAAGAGMTPPPDPYGNLPPTLSLTGVVRDFKGVNETHGHADFERVPTGGYGHYVGMIQDQLGADGKPVFASTGHLVSSEARDAAGHNIIGAKSYLAAHTGDTRITAAAGAGGSSTTSDNFAQWHRDVPGVNLSSPLSITLTRVAGTNHYTFNDQTDPVYQSLGGFFPINGRLFGNTPGQNKNFGFAFELDTNFTYHRNAGQVFNFTGDDDVWVFIDGKLVIDLGGVHSAVSQAIDVDRCSWLQDGMEYRLKFLFTERHTTASNLRIDTTLDLRNVSLPATAGLND